MSEFLYDNSIKIGDYVTANEFFKDAITIFGKEQVIWTLPAVVLNIEKRKVFNPLLTVKSQVNGLIFRTDISNVHKITKEESDLIVSKANEVIVSILL